jgi:hypothetical protein
MHLTCHQTAGGIDSFVPYSGTLCELVVSIGQRVEGNGTAGGFYIKENMNCLCM